jgi:hypothetical protein
MMAEATKNSFGKTNATTFFMISDINGLNPTHYIRLGSQQQHELLVVRL